MRHTWYGDRATATFRRKLAGNLDHATGRYVQLVQAAISIQGPPRSAPGDPPHIDQGDLIESYTHVTDFAALVADAGTNLDYAAYLEAGTPTMRPRPHLVATLLVHANDLARLVCQP